LLGNFPVFAMVFIDFPKMTPVLVFIRLSRGIRDINFAE
jgi:hypothetical protein